MKIEIKMCHKMHQLLQSATNKTTIYSDSDCNDKPNVIN